LSGLALVAAGTLISQDFAVLPKPDTEIYIKHRIGWVKGIGAANQLLGTHFEGWYDIEAEISQ
jgi:hypothetical protein